ncbi:MAG TPA: response regulator transcription factor [Streptosporangiaceae bacterium]|nr:response regulator transcription factor [Streptosporangiaceae bacterium]
MPGFRSDPTSGTKAGHARPRRPTLRLLVVDDHPIVRDGVALLVGHTSWVEVAGYARRGREALALAADLQPDVILLDLRLPDMLGSELITGLRARAPHTTVVVFTAFAGHAALAAAREAGASAVLLKDATQQEMLALLSRIRSGAPLGWPDDRDPLEARRSSALERVGMTAREYDVLRRVALGETNPEIAAAMHLSRNTVKSYLQSAFAKLGARNRVEALLKAGELDLL